MTLSDYTSLSSRVSSFFVFDVFKELKVTKYNITIFIHSVKSNET